MGRAGSLHSTVESLYYIMLEAKYQYSAFKARPLKNAFFPRPTKHHCMADTVAAKG